MRNQAHPFRMIRITQEALEQVVWPHVVTWGDPDHEGVYTPTVFRIEFAAPRRPSWRDTALDLAAVFVAIVAGAILGVALS